MFMGVAIDGEKRINLYKHYWTRGYINIDDEGNCFAYRTEWVDNEKDPWEDGAYRSWYEPVAKEVALQQWAA